MTLGKQPRDWLWFMMENVPLMIAWLPTTEANIATARTGHLTLSTHTKEDVRHQIKSEIEPITTQRKKGRTFELKGAFHLSS